MKRDAKEQRRRWRRRRQRRRRRVHDGGGIGLILRETRGGRRRRRKRRSYITRRALSFTADAFFYFAFRRTYSFPFFGHEIFPSSAIKYCVYLASPSKGPPSATRPPLVPGRGPTGLPVSLVHVRPTPHPEPVRDQCVAPRTRSLRSGPTAFWLPAVRPLFAAHGPLYMRTHPLPDPALGFPEFPLCRLPGVQSVLYHAAGYSGQGSASPRLV